MAHSRSREISEKIASDLENKAAQLEQNTRDEGSDADTPRKEC